MSYKHVQQLINVYKKVDAIARKGNITTGDTEFKKVMKLMEAYMTIVAQFPEPQDTKIPHFTTKKKFKDECASIKEMFLDPEQDLFIKMNSIPPVYLERVLPIAFVRHLLKWSEFPIDGIENEPWFDKFFKLYGEQVIWA